MQNTTICTFLQILLELLNHGGWGRGITFLFESIKGGEGSEYLSVRIILK
jgi:hypothetical protein